MAEEITGFSDLEAWKKSHELTLKVYQITKSFPKDELFGVVSQLRRAAASVGANIAEGFARYHFNDKVRFYYHSRGSAAEVQNFLFLSRDLNYIDSDQCAQLFEEARRVLQLINGLIRSIEKQQ